MKIILMALLLLVNVQAKSLFSNDAQADSSKYIGGLKDLVISTQKTRGLTNSYLNGNTAALMLVYENQKDMKSALVEMESSNLANDPVINTRASAISKALIKLNRKSFKMEPSVVFDGYTEQIESILMLAQTVSNRNAKELNPLGKDASTLMMEVILPMTEYVGRMRGKGAGIAAKGEITEEQTMQIYSMISEINSLEENIQESMNTILNKYPDSYNTIVSSTMRAIQSDTLDYVNLTKTTLLKTPGELDPTDYFDQGTDLISLLIKLYNANNKALLKDSEGWL